ncbi:MAG: DLW-39 family protein [Cellulomonadaceae bacterium]|jgi:hypothetical protein|nr:DLW-39 family protein [Cellulomonadaceae bacterium]
MKKLLIAALAVGCGAAVIKRIQQRNAARELWAQYTDSI